MLNLIFKFTFNPAPIYVTDMSNFQAMTTITIK